MYTRVKTYLRHLRRLVHRPGRRDVLVFLIFLAISACLWSVLTVSQEEQVDLRLPVRVTHVPDSVTLIALPPEALNVSVNARGMQILKSLWGNPPTLNIDFRVYNDPPYLLLGDAELKALARNALNGSTIILVSPDSIRLPFTSAPPYRLPVNVDSKVNAGLQASLIGRPRLSIDSVSVYTIGRRLPYNVNSISTEPIRINDINATTTVRTRLVAPSGTRVIPDSVDVTFEVEPQILKSRRVVIEPINVPSHLRLITFPAQMDVHFMMPMSVYKNSDPHVRVVADYHRINPATGKVQLRLLDVPRSLQHVELASDSAEYILERFDE